MSNFQKYSAFYDLLYRDKDYVAEVRYVAEKIRSASPSARSILELGSGTGRHGRLLADMGFDVYGVERSTDMVAVANSHDKSASDSNGRFACQVGDICDLDLGRRFDAVISLFHVISYQTTDEALSSTFAVAASHLAPGGVFLFDVWHGPAVMADPPRRRIKTVSDDRYRVHRMARPEVNRDRNTVKVIYDMECEDRGGGEVIRFSEDHLMRYLFEPEIGRVAVQNGMRIEESEEFLTRKPPSAETWGVAYLLRKQ